jgi:hypothetical protein
MIKEKEEIEVKQRPQNVYQSIEAMTEILAKQGISKDKGGNKDINYKFRGIDDIRNASSPIMKECALVILPKMVKREEKERTTKNGGLAIWVVLEVDFELVNTIDGSKTNVAIIAEAVDYSDKSTQKAMSQAYKTLAINIFNIPTEGEQDTDNEKKEFVGKRVGAFQSDELRKLWVENCKDAFDRAENITKLKDIESFNHEKLIIMSASDDVADKNGANEIRQLYKTKYDSFMEESKKGKL